MLAAKRIAEAAGIEQLAEAISPERAFNSASDRFVFRCPRCLHVDQNGGSAEVTGTWRWWCRRCRADSTIAELQRVALEDPDAVMALLASGQ
jgi:hypothetical protein